MWKVVGLREKSKAMKENRIWSITSRREVRILKINFRDTLTEKVTFERRYEVDGVFSSVSIRERKHSRFRTLRLRNTGRRHVPRGKNRRRKEEMRFRSQ